MNKNSYTYKEVIEACKRVVAKNVILEQTTPFVLHTFFVKKKMLDMSNVYIGNSYLTMKKMLPKLTLEEFRKHLIMYVKKTTGGK